MSNKDYIVRLLQDTCFSLKESFESLNFFKQKVKPSYIAYNISWFTDSSWLERLQAYGQFNHFLDHSNREYFLK